MPINLIAPVALMGAKTLITALNKPKRKNYDPAETLTMLDRQISNNEADIANRTLMNTMTRNAKSMGATMYQQQQRGIGAMEQRGDISEGQAARGLLEAGTQIQSGVGEMMDRAVLAQEQHNVSMKERIESARLQYAQMKDQGRMAYNADKQQWKNELMGSALDTVTTGFNSYLTKIQNDEVQSAVQGVLKGRNLADLSDTDLSGLYTTLLLAKLGIKLGGSK